MKKGAKRRARTESAGSFVLSCSSEPPARRRQAKSQRAEQRTTRALKKGGALFLELGDRQAGAALALFSGRPWRKSGLFKDLCGKKRFVFAEKK